MNANRLSLYSGLREMNGTPLHFIANPEQAKSLSVQAHYMDDMVEFMNTRMPENKSYMYLNTKILNGMLSDYNIYNKSIAFMYSFNKTVLLSDYSGGVRKENIC